MSSLTNGLRRRNIPIREARAFFPGEIIFSALIVTIACKPFFCSLAFSRDHDDRLSSVIVKASIWWHDKMPRCSPACSWWFPFWLIIINLSSSGYEKIWVSTANLRRGAYSLGSWASMATGWSRNCCCCGDVTPMFMANCPALLHEYARIAERR